MLCYIVLEMIRLRVLIAIGSLPEAGVVFPVRILIDITKEAIANRYAAIQYPIVKMTFTLSF